MAENLANYQVGQLDYNGEEITEVWSRHEKFVIYATKKRAIDSWLAKPEENDYRFLAEWSLHRHRIEDLANKSIQQRYNVNSQLALALESGWLGATAAAIQSLVELEQRIQMDLDTTDRIHYLLTAVIFVALLTVVALLGRCLCSNLEVQFKMVLLGAYGGVLSVLTGLKKLKVDAGDVLKITIPLAISRILIAMLSGLIAYWAIEADLLLSALKHSVTGVNIIAVMAGFSERFVPNLLERVEEKAGTPKQTT